MSVKKRVKAVESKVESETEKVGGWCNILVWPGEPLKCPRTEAVLSEDREECRACPVPEKQRVVIHIVLDVPPEEAKKVGS